MNKLFTKITSLALGAAMMIGVGVSVGSKNKATAVFADNATFDPSNFTGQGTSGTGDSISATVNGVTFACDKGYGGKEVRCYKNGTITISSSNTITAISFSWSGSYSGGLKSSYTNLSTTSWSTKLGSQIRMTECVVTYSGGTPVVTTYTVSYDANGGTGTMTDDDSPYDAGETVTVKSNSFTRDGYNFTGFNTAANGGGTSYAEGATFSIGANTTLYAQWSEIPIPGLVTASKTINEIVSDNNYTVSSGSSVTCYTSFSLDSHITVSTSGSANCGSFWGSTTKDWRLYQAQGGDITISAGEGYTIRKITITYNIDKTGTLLDGSTVIASGATQTLSASSKTFTVGNTSTATNGQVRVTAIEVKYVEEGLTATQITDDSTVGGPYSLTIPSAASTSLFITTKDDTSTKLEGFTWTPADPTVVSTSVSGTTCTVTALKEGSTTVTASKTGYVSSTVTINVTDLTPSVSFGDDSHSSKTIKVGDGLSITATGKNIGGSSITYTSDHPEFVSVNSSTGAVIAEAVGTARITASATVGNVTYSDYYDVTVREAQKGETIDNPFTVDEAIAYIDTLGGETSSEKYYVKGIVSQSGAASTKSGESVSHRDVYVYSDDGETSNAMLFYYAYLDLPTAPEFDESADSMLYYEVIGYGYAKKYNSTYELASVKLPDQSYDNVYIKRATAATMTSVSASIKEGTYKADMPLSASDINVSANYNHFKPSETVTTGYTWTVNGVANGNLNVGDNAVVVSYNNFTSDSFNVVGTNAHATDIMIDDELALYVGDEKSITYVVDPEDYVDTISWSVTASNPSGCATVDQTGKVTGVAAGTATVTATVNGHSDTCSVTVNALTDPVLNVSTGTGKTSYKFGEALDTTGWSATYTDGKGVSTPVQMSELDFGSLNYIGEKSLKATYNNVESNAVVITVTNNGATCGDQTLLESEGFLGSDMPSGWSQSGGGNYAESNAPYRLKLDGTGDKVFASVNTSAARITVELGVKMIGGASSSSFTVKAYSSADIENLGDPISSIASKTLTISGKQNDIVTPSETLVNDSGVTVRTIEFTFTKGSNVGVGTGKVTVNDSANFYNNQALAYARYFLEQTQGYCDATIDSTVKTNLINEYNWMQPEAKALFTGADIVRGKGVTYPNDLSQALSRYVNMIEEKGYSDADFLNLGENVIKKSTISSQLGNLISGNSSTVIIIISVIGVSALGGFFFLRKRKEI